MTIEQARTSADNLENELADLPEKFKGKTAVEIAKAYKDLETAYSRQGSELGDYRKLAATLAETATRPTPVEREERKQITTDDLFADPSKTIDEVIDSHPVVQKARETAENLERQLAQKDFESRHPNFKSDLQDPEFANWVKANPSLMKMAARADQYDFDAADQLFGLWREKKSVKDQVEKQTKELMDKKARERAGTLEGSSGSDASSEVIMSRAEVREIHRRALLGDRSAKAKWEDPKFQAARRKAYADGRVS